uniref:Uncharacterized protein n=1 Tax=Arundo donax TaxID=35708 RepID=A0A0A9AD62_ARUDO
MYFFSFNPDQAARTPTKHETHLSSDGTPNRMTETDKPCLRRRLRERKGQPAAPLQAEKSAFVRW